MNKKLNIAFLDASTLGEVDVIKKVAELGTYSSYETTTSEQTIERLKGCNVVLTNKVVINKEIMEACPEIKLICVTATGTNNIDLDYAAKKKITVKNVAGYSTDSVAQTTFSMLLYLLNSTNYFDNYVKSGQYANSPIFTNHGREFWELKNKQFGIIGMGTIGKKVATIADAFEAKVVYYSTSGKNLSAPYPQLPLDDLLKTSDVISIHCPLTDGTLNLIGTEQFKKMRPSAILLNAGRGKIVNENELAEALNNKLIASAGLDVLEHEPIRSDSPLLKINEPEKLLITPHIAWVSKEARTILAEGVYQNILDWQANR